MDGMKKICITGGHATPALAVVEQMKKRELPYELIWIGRIRAFDSENIESEEYSLVTEKGIRFLPLTTGRLSRVFSLASIVSWFKVPYGFFQALMYCAGERPDLVLSFGGYIALPVALAAWLFGIPVITHEQTSSMGLANRLIGIIASKVCISDMSMLSGLGDKGVYTGLPIREALFRPPGKLSFTLPKHPNVLFVIGGSTGSQSINRVIFSGLSKLLGTYTVVHQTGKQGIEEAERKKESLVTHQRAKYFPFSYLSESDVSWLFHNCRIVIARAGANTVGELTVAGAVSLYIPLPWAVGDEQKKNAQSRVVAGSALILDQKDLSPTTLAGALARIEVQYNDFKKNAQKNTAPYSRDAASKIVDLVVACIS